jgi:hypothetical protein
LKFKGENQVLDFDWMLSEATLTQLLLLLGLNLDEEMEEACVLRVNAFAFFGNVAAKHFPVSFRTFSHRPSFLRRVHLLRTRPLEGRGFVSPTLGGGRIGD